jgi:hypothetical protein
VRAVFSPYRGTLPIDRRSNEIYGNFDVFGKVLWQKDAEMKGISSAWGESLY